MNDHDLFEQQNCLEQLHNYTKEKYDKIGIHRKIIWESWNNTILRNSTVLYHKIQYGTDLLARERQDVLYSGDCTVHKSEGKVRLSPRPHQGKGGNDIQQKAKYKDKTSKFNTKRIHTRPSFMSR